MSAKVFSPEEKGEIEKNAGRGERETIELYPQGGLMVIHSEKCSDKASESNREKILMPQSEVFKNNLEEITTIDTKGHGDGDGETVGRRN